MKGKIISVVQNSVVIKADVKTDTKKMMFGMGSKGSSKERYENFNLNKIVNYKILVNNKFLGKISKVIGRIDDFFLVGDIYDKKIASDIVGEDVEILRHQNKQSNKNKKKKWKKTKNTTWKKEIKKR